MLTTLVPYDYLGEIDGMINSYENNLVFPKSELELESRSAEIGVLRTPAWSPTAWPLGWSTVRVWLFWVVPPHLSSLKETWFSWSAAQRRLFWRLVLACSQELFPAWCLWQVLSVPCQPQPSPVLRGLWPCPFSFPPCSLLCWRWMWLKWWSYWA